MQTLKQAFETFNQKNTFKPGDIVEWKPGMKHKRSDGPFIVVELLGEPIVDAIAEAGSAYFREPLDLVLGSFIGGDFVTFYYDSRRMQPVNE